MCVREHVFTPVAAARREQIAVLSFHPLSFPHARLLLKLPSPLVSQSVLHPSSALLLCVMEDAACGSSGSGRLSVTAASVRLVINCVSLYLPLMAFGFVSREQTGSLRTEIVAFFL